MGLRETARDDVKAILENTDDFGWPITLTDPSGNSQSLVGFSTDVFREFDQDGNLVSLRAASVALSMQSISDAGFSGLPEALPDSATHPWLVAFEDSESASYQFKVRESNPDRAVGLVVLHLEEWSL